MSLGRIFYRDVDGKEKHSYIFEVLSLAHIEAAASVFALYSNAAIYKVSYSLNGSVVQNPHVAEKREYLEPDVEETFFPGATAVDESHRACDAKAVCRFSSGHTKTQIGIYAPKQAMLEPASDFGAWRVKQAAGEYVAEAFGTMTGRADLTFLGGRIQFSIEAPEYGL